MLSKILSIGLFLILSLGYSMSGQTQSVVVECTFVEFNSQGKPEYECTSQLKDIVAEIDDWVNRQPQDQVAVSGSLIPMNFFQFLLTKEDLFNEINGLDRPILRQQWQYQADDLLNSRRPNDVYPTITAVNDQVIVQSYRCYENGCHEWTTLVYDKANDHLSICLVIVPVSFLNQSKIDLRMMQNLQTQLLFYTNKKLEKSLSIRMDQVQQWPGYVCGNPQYDAANVVDRIWQLRRSQ